MLADNRACQLMRVTNAYTQKIKRRADIALKVNHYMVNWHSGTGDVLQEYAFLMAEPVQNAVSCFCTIVHCQNIKFRHKLINKYRLLVTQHEAEPSARHQLSVSALD